MARQANKTVEIVEFSPTLPAGTLAVGDAMHTGAIELANILQGHNHSGITVDFSGVDADDNATNFDLLIFDSDPSSSTITADAKFVLHADDRDKLLGVIKVVEADYTDLVDERVWCVTKAVGVKSAKTSNALLHSRSLFVVLVSQDTDTVTATGMPSCKLKVEQD